MHIHVIIMYFMYIKILCFFFYISVSGVDTAYFPKCVSTNHNVYAYVAARGTEAGTNSQRTTTLTQV